MELPSEFRDAAATRLTNDYCCLVSHILSNPDMAYFLCLPSGRLVASAPFTALFQSIEQQEFPDLAVLQQLVAWVCFTTTRNRQQRPLSPDERTVEAAAWRLSDGIHGLRVEYRPRFLRADGSPD